MLFLLGGCWVQSLKKKLKEAVLAVLFPVRVLSTGNTSSRIKWTYIEKTCW
jgi:hypothetical protein